MKQNISNYKTLFIIKENNLQKKQNVQEDKKRPF